MSGVNKVAASYTDNKMVDVLPGMLAEKLQEQGIVVQVDGKVAEEEADFFFDLLTAIDKAKAEASSGPRARGCKPAQCVLS